jgi:hypothetical protein
LTKLACFGAIPFKNALVQAVLHVLDIEPPSWTAAMPIALLVDEFLLQACMAPLSQQAGPSAAPTAQG